MTTMVRTEAPASSRGGAAGGPGGALTGTGTLIRFVLRRDRIKLPAWLLGISLLLYYMVTAAASLTETAEQQQDVSRFMQGAVGAVFGPGYGRDDITADLYVAGVYGLVFFILAAVMSLQLVARHTRVDEQSGRAELVRAGVAGRYAQLTAVLIVAVGANVLLALLLCGAMTAKGYDGGDGLLFGASVGAVGLVFAGVTAITVQLTEYSKSATGIAGAVLGAAWVVRAMGDMMRDYGSPLSWFSPLAWSHQTRSYVDGRWWPLLLSVGLAATTAAIGYLLSGRRDVGAGLVAARAGAPVAAPWLRSPLAAAFRLQRASLIWWTVAVALFAFMFGGVADQITDTDNISADRIEMFGGSVEGLVDGYLGVITLVTAALAGIMVVQGVQALRTEETRGRAEPLLATATSRWTWFGSYLTVTAVGLVRLLLVAGLLSGVGAAVAVGDGSYVWAMVAAHVAHVPGLLLLLGLAALLFGVLPKAIGVAWGVLGLGLFVGIFGAILDFPQWLRNLSPMEHAGQPPMDDISWPATATLLVIAAGLMAAGLVGFRRRDLETK